MDLSDPKAVGPRIRMMLPELTPLEARLVDMVLARRDFDEATPLKEVAEAAGVSEAMVVKLSKKLGFSGYREFRAGLVEYNRLPTADLHRELSPGDSSADTIAKVFRTAIQALEETRAVLDLGAFERAAEIVHAAGQRDFYGAGGSAQIARDMAHKFLRIGLRASVQDDAHMMLMSASLLGPRDAVVAFSHSGRTTAVLEAVTLARANGARVVAVTAYPQSPLAEMADATLIATAQGSTLTGESAAARVAKLTLLDAVFVAVAQRDYAAAESSLDKTMRAVRAKRRTA